MKKILLVLSVLIIASLACSFFAWPATSGQLPEATANTPQELGSPTLEAPTSTEITDQPNLILFAFLTDSASTGNGMERVNIGFYGENASSRWWTYRLTGGFGMEGAQCIWGFGATWGNNFQGTRPLLGTKEGYSYTAVFSQDPNCGPRITWDVPPGAIFGGVGKTYEEGSDWWGKVQFDIPEQATPKTLTLPYGSWAWSDFTGSYDDQMVTTEVKPYSDFKQVTNPFDAKYAGSLKINKVGDKLKFGDLATMSVQAQAAQPDGSFPITLNIVSLDQGYPLDFKSALGGNATYLIFQDGTFCCQLGLYDWGWETGQQQMVVGPQQSVDLQAIVQNPRHLKVWLVGEFTLKELNAGSQEASEQFIIELPN